MSSHILTLEMIIFNIRSEWFSKIIYFIIGNYKTSDDIELSEAIKRSFNIQTSQDSSENGMYI